MKRIALSLLVIASSGAYVYDQAGSLLANDLTDTTGPADTGEQSGSLLPPPPVQAPKAVPLETRQSDARQGPAPRAEANVSRETTAAIAATGLIPAPAAAPAVSLGSQPPLQQPLSEGVSPGTTETFAVTPAVYIPIPQSRPAYPQGHARVIRAAAKLGTHGYADGIYTGPATDAYYGIIQIQALVQDGRLTALKILRYPNDRRTSVNINRQALPMLRDEAISAQSADVDIISGATLTSKAFIQSLGGALKKASS